MTLSHLVALGRTIRKVREAQQLTQVVLARRARISQASLSKIELGQMEPSLTVLRRLAHALETSAGVLLDDTTQ